MKRRYLILIGVLVGMGLSAVMQTYLSVSMPSIANELGGMSLYNWVFGAYMLSSTVSIPLFGKMADLFGKRKLYLAGLVLFSLGLIFCGLSVNMHMLVASRTLMGVGAGAVTPSALGMMGELYDEKDFPAIFGLMGVIQVLSNMTGPLLGGFLSDEFSWRWGFLLFLPLEFACAVLICLGPSPVAADKNQRRAEVWTILKELDWIGTLLLSGGLICLVLGLQLISREEILKGVCLFVLSLLILVFSVHWEKRCREPLIPFGLLQIPAIRNGMISVFLLGIVHYSSSTYLSLYFQNVLGKSATNAGILLVPMLVSAGVASALCGRLPRPAVHTANLLLWFLAWLSFIGIGLAGGLLDGLAAVLFSIPVGLALGFMLPLFLGRSQTHADNSNRAVSGGLVQLSRNLGGTMGVSLLGIWVSGPLPVGTGLTGIFLSLAAISGFAFLFTRSAAAVKLKGVNKDDSMV